MAPTEEQREAAVELANFLASNGTFDPGFYLPPPSPNVYLCFDVAAVYSEHLAIRYPASAVKLLEVASQLQEVLASNCQGEINGLLLRVRDMFFSIFLLETHSPKISC